MRSQIRIVLSLFFVVLTVLVFFLFLAYSSNSYDKPYLIRTKGGTLSATGKVLVQGDDLEPGDRLSVLTRSAQLGLPKKFRLKLQSNSSLLYETYYPSSQSYGFRVSEGQGIADAGEKRLRLKFKNLQLELLEGRLRWKQQGSGVSLDVESESRLKIINSEDRVKKLQWVDQGIAMDTSRRVSDYPAKTGSLIPGSDVLKRVLEEATDDSPPQSLRDVFGHWVRDRWGNIYFYDRKKQKIIIKSGGPDERIGSDDDQTWTGTINN